MKQTCTVSWQCFINTIRSSFDAWLFVANYTKLGTFVAKLEKIYVENRNFWS